MKERPYEKYVKESLERYFKRRKFPPFTIVRGNDPPDYYVNMSKQRILLEVTRAEAKYIRDNNQIGNRKTVDESLLALFEQLHEQFRLVIPSGTSLFLHINGPAKNMKKFETDLKAIIGNINWSKNDFYEKKKFVIAGEEVTIKSIIHGSQTRMKVLGAVGSKRPIMDIQLHTDSILAQIIHEKELKTKIINGQKWKGTKWLAILNNYILSDPKNYKRAFAELGVKHSFAKIFLIYDKGEVAEIFRSK